MDPARLRRPSTPRPVSGGGLGGTTTAPGPVPSPAPVTPAASPVGAGGVELVSGVDPLTAELVRQAPVIRQPVQRATGPGNSPAPTTDQTPTQPLRGSNRSGSSKASALLPLGLAAAGTVAAVLLLASGRKPRAAGPARPAAQLGGVSPQRTAPLQNIPFENTTNPESAAYSGTFGTLAGGGR